MGQERTHFREPVQERSRRTLERLVDAARGLVADVGVEGLTVAAVVERAGSSVGSFYARFEGKDDLIRYLEERVWSVARERWEASLEERDWGELELEGVVRTVVRLLVRLQNEDAEARRALGRQEGSGLPLLGEAARFHADLERDVRELLLRHRARIDHPDPERAATVAYRWAVAGIRGLLAAPASPGTDPGAPGPRVPASRSGPFSTFTAEEVADEVARGMLAYLGGGRSGAASGEGVDFFDVWQ